MKRLRIRIPARATLLPVLLALLLGGCAWSNRANRPVWNAFEAHLVPESDGAFYATLPLTVPAGLVAILTDTFVVHPAQISGDAWDDAGDLWRDVPWSGEYYTQLALFPFRLVATPLVFVGSFLGRSCFDIPRRSEHQHPGHIGPGAEGVPVGREASADHPPPDAKEELLAKFRLVAAGASRAVDLRLPRPPASWDETLQAGFTAALARGTAPGRLALVLYARRHDLPPARSDAALGLRDPDPVVRYELLSTLERSADVPDDVRNALLNDTDEMVRLVARETWL